MASLFLPEEKSPQCSSSELGFRNTDVSSNRRHTTYWLSIQVTQPFHTSISSSVNRGHYQFLFHGVIVRIQKNYICKAFSTGHEEVSATKPCVIIGTNAQQPLHNAHLSLFPPLPCPSLFFPFFLFSSGAVGWQWGWIREEDRLQDNSGTCLDFFLWEGVNRILKRHSIAWKLRNSYS